LTLREPLLFRALVDNPEFVSAGRMHQDFELEKPKDDRLLDALSLLEIHGDEVRQTISRLFLGFFPTSSRRKSSQTLFLPWPSTSFPKKILGWASGKRA
jgi:hypothetical protein